MTRTAISGLAMVGSFIVILVVASVAFIELDGKGVRGTVIGAGLGLLNLALGYFVTRRTLRRGSGIRTAMAMFVGGFLARLIVVAVLIVLFQRTGVADPAAFALTFLVFFFVYLFVEVLLVERSLDAKQPLDAKQSLERDQSFEGDQSLDVEQSLGGQTLDETPRAQ
jgi:hypothetical protein